MDRVPVTIGQMVARILPDAPALDPASRARVERDVRDYVTAQVGAMPAFLRLPFHLALHGFALLPLLRYGRPFGALPAARQAAYLTLWSEAPVQAMRDVVKLVRSTALLIYFDHPLVRARLDAQRPAASADDAT